MAFENERKQKSLTTHSGSELKLFRNLPVGKGTAVTDPFRLIGLPENGLKFCRDAALVAAVGPPATHRPSIRNPLDVDKIHVALVPSLTLRRSGPRVDTF